ncbi:MAG TPA: DEAD/DEAH box helicase [Candidatus Limnocylindrales bacterium]
MSFDHLGLAPELVRVVADQGYTEPTPVQAEAIPLVLAGRDVLAGAQTGTGKTAAFVLPILQLLNAGRPANEPAPPAPARSAQGLPAYIPTSRDRRNATPVRIRTLVLAPTRELALQVEESVRTYGARRPIRSTTIYGGVGFDPQVRALRSGPEIVVATPGRLLDHLGQNTIDLSHVEILVLDEADRLLDMGFIRDIRKIIGTLPRERQTLLFSATFSDDVRRLAADILRDPAMVQVARRNTAAELVRQLVLPVDRERKRELLAHLVKSGRIDQALVFARTKHGANRLAEQLERDGIVATAIHGNKSQPQRIRALNDFKSGRVAILVATDLAARGIDIDALPHVVNYELPMVAEDYVHRIGRTGRAGVEGDAISLVCVDEHKMLRDIEQVLGHRIPTETIAGFEPDRNIRPEPIRLRSQGIQPGGRPVGGFAPARRSQPVGRLVPNGRPNHPGQATQYGPGAAGRSRDGQMHRPSRDGMTRPSNPQGGRPSGLSMARPQNGRPGSGRPQNGRPSGMPLGQYQPAQARPAHARGAQGIRGGGTFNALPGEHFRRNAAPGRSS